MELVVGQGEDVGEHPQHTAKCLPITRCTMKIAEGELPLNQEERQVSIVGISFPKSY